MSHKYELLPLHLCEMLEREFHKVHPQFAKELPEDDWLLGEDEIESPEDNAKIINNKKKIIEMLNMKSAKDPKHLAIQEGLKQEGLKPEALTADNLYPSLNKLLQKKSLLYEAKYLPLGNLLSREEEQLREMASYVKDNEQSVPQDDFIRVNRLLLEAAFPDEIKSVYEWRLKRIWKKIHDLPEQEGAMPRSALCLSGGGIRSASFALGVIQGLARYQLLEKFDYLSTVSGGGYIGSWLTAWIYRQDLKQKEHGQEECEQEGIKAVTRELRNESPPVRLEPASKPIQFLREYSNFITPKVGLFTTDTWAFVAIYLRNLFVNWLAIIPLLLVVLILPRLYAAWVNSILSGIGNSSWIIVGFFGLLALLASVICIAFNKPGVQDKLGTQDSQPSWWSNFIKQQHGILLVGLLPLVISAICLTLFSVPWLKLNPPTIPEWIIPIPGWIIFYLIPLVAVTIGWVIARHKDLKVNKWMPSELATLLLTTLVTLSLVFIFVKWGYPMQKYLEEVCGISFLMVPIFTVVAIPLFMAICFFGITLFVALSTRITSLCGDDVREWWGRAGGWLLIAGLVWLALSALVILGPVLLAKIPGWISGIGGISGIITFILGRSGRTSATSEQSRKLSLLDRILTHIATVAAVLFLTIFFIFLSWLTSKGVGWLTDIGQLDHLETIEKASPLFILFLLSVMLVIGLLWALAIDLNKFSLHEAYRNRLIRVFLGASNDKRKPHPFTGFDLQDNIQMYKLGCVKPMPVVNMALNVVRGDRLAWQERKAETFCVTPMYSGCCFLGYRQSKNYGGEDGISLGTAITISGAAVSPNMGYSSSPTLAFALALLNIRLGWWLGNPGIHGQLPFQLPLWPSRKAPFRRRSPVLSLMPLLAEGFGLANDRRRYVYLSDGGHFDNLGLYEMVLRRCHLIVVSDAGQDGEHTFEDLANAVRKIRIDLGIEITFDHEIQIYPRDPDKKAGNWAIKKGGYAAIGRIEYSVMDGHDAPDGILIYLKPAIYGSEPRDVLQYAKAHPEFPHESTIDQFFSESQFESYRRLGCHVIETICGEELQEDKDSLYSFVKKAIPHAYKHAPDKVKSIIDADLRQNKWGKMPRDFLPASLPASKDFEKGS